jgi:hypothetical protein
MAENNFRWYDDLGFLSVLDGRNWAQVPAAIADVINDVGESLLPGLALPNDLTASQSKYNFNSRVFPSDIGSGFQGHFLVININVQTGSIMGKVNKSNFNFNVIGEDEGGTELSKTDAYRYRIDNTWKTESGKALGTEFGGVNTRTRFTRRIEESIALYMPNSELTFSDSHDFENISLTKFVGSGITDMIKTGVSFIPEAENIVGAITNAVGKYGGSASQILANSPINPKVEILFANTFQREFAFEFLLSPSSQQEANDLENIIRTIRFHAAPEYRGVNQFFWLPPSEFDLTFYYVDAAGNILENTKIPRINTCVLKQVDVSYAPSGAYSTFDDGHPVQTRMVLRFIETEVNSKLRIAQGF